MWPSVSVREQTTEKRSHSNKNRPCELWIHVLQCDRKKGSRRHTPRLPAACEKDVEKWGVGLGWGVGGEVVALVEGWVGGGGGRGAWLVYYVYRAGLLCHQHAKHVPLAGMPLRRSPTQKWFYLPLMLLYVHGDHKNCSVGTGSPGRPPRLSHSSRALKIDFNIQVQCCFTSTKTI